MEKRPVRQVRGSDGSVMSNDLGRAKGLSVHARDSSAVSGNHAKGQVNEMTTSVVK